MKNLFDIALEIRYNEYIIDGLQEVSNSSAYPVIPIALQQKIQNLIKTLSDRKMELSVYSWGNDNGSLEDFMEFLDSKGIPHPIDSNNEFLKNTTNLVTQYLKTSVRPAREVIKKLDLPDIEMPKKRKKP